MVTAGRFETLMVVTPIRSRTASCSEKWGNHSVPQLVRAECDQLAFGERARHCPDRRRSRGCVPCGSPPAGRDGGRGSVCPWTPRSRHVWPGASHTTIPLPRSATPRGACAAAPRDCNVGRAQPPALSCARAKAGPSRASSELQVTSVTGLRMTGNVRIGLTMTVVRGRTTTGSCASAGGSR